jgi:hypothetical protein
VPYVLDSYGFLKQRDPKPFKYTLEYKARQSTNTAMSWLRLGWLMNYIPVDTLRTFNVCDVGAGNLNFVRESAKLFRRVVPFDILGTSIGEDELYGTQWDLVVLSDVLEHYHDIDTFWKLRFKYALISFPETPEDTDLQQWRHYKPDEHIYMMTANTFSTWVHQWLHIVVAQGNPEDAIRTRWNPNKANISTFLIRK